MIVEFVYGLFESIRVSSSFKSAHPIHLFTFSGRLIQRNSIWIYILLQDMAQLLLIGFMSEDRLNFVKSSLV